MRFRNFHSALLAAGLLFPGFSCFGQNGPTVEVYNASGQAAPGETISLWRLPINVSVTAAGGYDDNPGASPNAEGSASASGSINLSYNFGTVRTRGTLAAGTGMTYYPELSGDQYDPNVYLTLNVSHPVSLRMLVNLAVNLRYQSEPDFSGDLTLDRRAGDYFSTEDSISVAYQWLPRFSTITSYALATVLYDSRAVADFRDRFDHNLSQSFRFLYLPVTTFALDYRLAITSYREDDRDSHTNALLLGLDHTFGPRLHGTFRAGAEYRSTEDPGRGDHDGLNPHVELGLSYILTGKATLNWNALYATQESYIPESSGSLTFRTGLQATYAFFDRIHTSLAFYYQHNDNGGIEFFGFDTSFTEDIFDVSIGASYVINRHLSANLGYSHTEVDSELSFRAYKRNRVYGGFTFSF